MRLTAVVCLLLFCNFSSATLANMKSKPSVFLQRIRTSRNVSNTDNADNTLFNSDVVLNTVEMIRQAGYPAETHIIMTEDGYLLTLHRIPGGNGSPTVLLQHGLLCTSADWVFLGKDKALAYLLADQGYDVWLGNVRGNTYSREHISLSPSELKFWNFSFNEIGIYDLPAMITFITNITSQPLHTYIGHSMGTTIFYVMASERPEIAQMVEKMISFAPVAFVNHVKSLIKDLLFPFSKQLKMIIRYLFHDEVLPQSKVITFFSKYLEQTLAGREILANIIFFICGYDHEQLDYNLLPVILSHDPAGTSSKTILHYVQMTQSAKFRQYDYGEKNLLIYNSVEPPNYNLTNISVPIALFYGSNDLLVSSVDVKRLYRSLPNVIDIYEVPWYKFNHVDFMWAKDAPKLVYERLFMVMKRKSLNNSTYMG